MRTHTPTVFVRNHPHFPLMCQQLGESGVKSAVIPNVIVKNNFETKRAF